MKLLHLIHSADPASGGPIENIRQMAPIYLSNGVEANVVTLDPPEAPYLKDFPLDVRSAGPTYGGKYGYCPALIPWLKRNHQNYDCIIVNGIWQFHSFACWAALHNTNTPYVVFTHGMLDPWFRHKYPLKHLKKWLYWPWAEYRVLRDAKVVLFTSEEERMLAAESFWLYKANPFVVGYGTRIPEFDLEALRRDFFSRYPNLQGKRLAVFIGRIHPKKGCDLLILAFHRTLARNPDWHLLMVGPDQVGWQAELEKMSETLGIRDRITWPGMLRDERKWSALAASEIFVLPSHQENFGIVVAEALACGVPVLISNKVNIWREIESDRAGFVEEDSPAGTFNLLSAWDRLEGSERANMKARAKECFKQHFDLGGNGIRFLEKLRSISQKSPAAKLK
ncbi:MAG: glycosyltransferase [Acidobacteria bacterium]|nr:glycosyltransferase [Acidobacteriota bacterium]